MADGNTKSKDTKDALERQQTDFEKDAAEDRNPPPRQGDPEQWRTYWQKEGYNDEEVEDKLEERDRYPVEEASQQDEYMREPEPSVAADDSEPSFSGSPSYSRGSHQQSTMPQSDHEDDTYEQSPSRNSSVSRGAQQEIYEQSPSRNSSLSRGAQQGSTSAWSSNADNVSPANQPLSERSGVDA